MRSHPGVAAKVFDGARRGTDQHRDDLHLADQDLVRHRRRPRGRGRHALHEAFELGADAIRPEDPTGRAPADGRRLSAVILGRSGRRRYESASRATGGRLDDPRSRASAAFRRRGRAVRVGALGRQGGWRSAGEKLTCRASSDEDSIQGFDLRPLLGRRLGQRRVAPRSSSPPAPSWSTTRATGGCTTTCRWSSPRSTRRGASRAISGIIANPNCSTMQLVVALKPLYDAAGIERSWSRPTRRSRAPARRRSTSCASSRTRSLRPGADPPAVYPHQIAFNVLPHSDTFRRRRSHRRGDAS